MDTKKTLDYLSTILNAIVNIIGGDLCDHPITRKIFTFTMNKVFIQGLKLEKIGYNHDLHLLITLHQLHVSYPMRAM